MGGDAPREPSGRAADTAASQRTCLGVCGVDGGKGNALWGPNPVAPLCWVTSVMSSEGGVHRVGAACCAGGALLDYLCSSTQLPVLTRPPAGLPAALCGLSGCATPSAVDFCRRGGALPCLSAPCRCPGGSRACRRARRTPVYPYRGCLSPAVNPKVGDGALSTDGAVGASAHCGQLGPMAFKDPFQLKPFCDALILRPNPDPSPALSCIRTHTAVLPQGKMGGQSTECPHCLYLRPRWGQRGRDAIPQSVHHPLLFVWRHLCLPSCWAGLSLAQAGINLLYNQDWHGDFWLLIVLSCSPTSAVFCSQEKPRERGQRAPRAAGGAARRGALKGETNSKGGDVGAPEPCCGADGSVFRTSPGLWSGRAAVGESAVSATVTHPYSCYHCPRVGVRCVCVQWQHGRHRSAAGLVPFLQGLVQEMQPACPTLCLHGAAAQ